MEKYPFPHYEGISSHEIHFMIQVLRYIYIYLYLSQGYIKHCPWVDGNLKTPTGLQSDETVLEYKLQH